MRRSSWIIPLSLLGLALVAVPALADSSARTASVLQAPGSPPAFDSTDFATNGLTNYLPASFFLAANDGDYTAKVGYVRFTYRF